MKKYLFVTEEGDFCLSDTYEEGDRHSIYHDNLLVFDLEKQKRVSAKYQLDCENDSMFIPEVELEDIPEGSKESWTIPGEEYLGFKYTSV